MPVYLAIVMHRVCCISPEKRVSDSSYGLIISAKPGLLDRSRWASLLLDSSHWEVETNAHTRGASISIDVGNRRRPTLIQKGRGPLDSSRIALLRSM
ncbi:hypothetical protein GLOTRDRAFT_112534, partial [Gloeophyllum trabeum ATCC 11539]